MSPAAFDHLTPEQLRQLAAQLSQRVDHLETLNQRLNHELAVLRRHRFARRSEQLNADQLNLLDEMIEADIAAIEAELETARPEPAKREPRQQPKRAPLPAELPRTLILHEPDSTQCACGCQLKRIGEDVSEKLDYTPGTFTVERHIRGKWVCAQCETLIQAPVPAQVIDKDIPTAGLLAQVMVAKFADHLPLCRQEKIFVRAGLAIARSTLAQWVGACGVQLQPLVDALRDCLLQQDVILADETPVQMLAPGTKKTQRAYVWAYAPSPFADLKAVVYDFRPSRAGEHARSFLGDWQGKLVCDDFAGYKASFEQGVTEIGCMAHARRKFFDLHAANQSQLAEQVLQYIGQLYGVEREGRELLAAQRRQLRQDKARPIIDGLHSWMLGQRQKVPEGSAIAKALDYSLKRWAALVRYLDDGNLPLDNNWIEVRHEVA